MVGAFEAAAVSWLIGQLRSHAEANAKASLGSWLKGNPFDNAMAEVTSEAITDAVTYILPPPADAAHVAEAFGVFNQLWPNAEAVEVDPTAGFLDHVHASTVAAMKACLAPHGQDADESSWDVLIVDLHITADPYEFAEVVTAMLVRSVQTHAAGPDKTLEGLASRLGEELAARRADGHLRLILDKFDSLPQMLDAAFERGRPALTDSIVADVRREIVAAAPDAHIQQVANSGVARNVRPVHAARFVGRSIELADLAANVGDQTIIGNAVEGVGGIGKTRLARQYALGRVKDEWPIVWWIDAAVDTESSLGELDAMTDGDELVLTRSRIVKGLVALGERLGIHLDDPNEAAAATRQVLEQRDDHWLVVVDNAEHPHSIVNLVPAVSGGGGQVLVTSRARGWSAVGLKSLRLGHLDDDAATELLETLIGESDPAVRYLAVEVLGGHALAIAQAGAHIAVHQITIEGYIERLNSDDVQSMFGTEDLGDYGGTVSAVYSATLNVIGFDATTLLGRLCWLDRIFIPNALVHALTADWDDARRNQTIAVLIRYRLLDPEESGVSMHNITQHFTQRLHPHSHAYALAIVAELLPDDVTDHQSWPVAIQLEPHIIAAAWNTPATATEDTNVTSAAALGNLGNVQQQLGRFEEAEASLQRALAIKEAVYGPDHPQVARTLSNLGNVQQQMGRFEEAEASQQRALAIFEAVYGPDHHEVAITLGNLGTVQQQLGRFDEAEASLQRALAIKEAVYGSDHPQVAITLGNLGTVQQQMGRFDEAEASLQRALAIFEAVYGPDHPQVARTLGNLGIVQRQLGRFDEAEASQQRALAIEEAAYGPDHHEVAITLGNLGTVQQQLGRFDEAEATQQRALAIKEAVYGPDHHEVAITLSNLGNAQRQLGRFDEAEATQQRALAIKEAAYGPDHHEVAITLSNLGNAQQQMGRSEEAEASLQRALAIKEAVYGPDHPQVAITLSNLGNVQQQMGRSEEAEATQQRAIAIFEAMYGSDHPQVAITLSNLGNVQQQMGRSEEAEASLQRALAIFEAVYGADHPQVARTLGNLGIVQRQLGRFDEAEASQQRALAIFEAVYGPDHPIHS